MIKYISYIYHHPTSAVRVTETIQFRKTDTSNFSIFRFCQMYETLMDFEVAVVKYKDFLEEYTGMELREF